LYGEDKKNVEKLTISVLVKMIRIIASGAKQSCNATSIHCRGNEMAGYMTDVWFEKSLVTREEGKGKKVREQ
jgi:hypothetical protein